MTKLPKYRITLFHPVWYKPWGDHQVSLEILNGRTRKYAPVALEDVGVKDVHTNDTN